MPDQPERLRALMTEDEIAALHEAAHAAYAVFGAWTRLAGPVALKGEGCGDVVMATDGTEIGRTLAFNPGFDRDIPRVDLICCLLAGPIAERLLRERGRTIASECDLGAMGRGDYAVAADQLAQFDPPRPGLREKLEGDVRRWLEQPENWTAIERFAAILLDRRRLEAEEATAILEGIRAEAAEGKVRTEAGLRPLGIAMFALLAMFVGAILYVIAQTGDRLHQHNELAEVTRKAVRIRKRYLDPHERKRQSRKAEAA